MQGPTLVALDDRRAEAESSVAPASLAPVLRQSCSASSAAGSKVTPLTVLDLFCGAGGLTQGFHSAGGFRTIRAVEMDEVAAASYRATFGDVVHVGSIADWLNSEEVPQADLVVGGPPCQGFSTLGRQDAEDARNVLWRDYARTIVRASPMYFVLENVGAFLRSAQFADLRDATRLGGMLEDYDFAAGVLNAADYGAPQARRRTILIGHHRDLPSAGLPEATHANRHIDVATALAAVSPEVGASNLPDRRVMVGNRPQPGTFYTRELHVGRTYSSVSLARIRSIPPGGNRFDLPDKLLPRCWREHRNGSADVMGRLRWDRPSVTIRTEFWKPEKGRYLHPVEDRALTHFEAALLQGFPASHRWVGSKVSIGRQIGNAVPIPLGKAVALHLGAQSRCP